MSSCFKVLIISSILLLTSACQDTLDTSSKLAKEQSIKQMMVGIYPQNQKIFKQALKTIYESEQINHENLTIEEVTALTDKKLKGKTVEDILYISFAHKKIQQANHPRVASRLKLKNKISQPIVKVSNQIVLN